MSAMSFKEQLAADIHNVFLNTAEFADIRRVNGREMPVLTDDNELLDRDRSEGSSHQEGLYLSRRLIYVARSNLGPRPALGSSLDLDGVRYRIENCTEEDGMFALELRRMRT